MKVLIVEDEEGMRSLIHNCFALKGHDVVDAATAEDGWIRFKEAFFDILILDVMLPGMSGFELCEAVREASPTVGIIMLTAKSQEMDKVTGLQSGADDYVLKPFSPMELIARAGALYRKVELLRKSYGRKEDGIIKNGSFELNKHNETLVKMGAEIELTATEYQIVRMFFENQDAILTRDEILNNVWGVDFIGSLKTVDVNIQRLRKKIGDDHIETVWGRGYKWKTA